MHESKAYSNARPARAAPATMCRTKTAANVWFIATLLLFCTVDIYACNAQGQNCMPSPLRIAYVWANDPLARDYLPAIAYSRNDGPIAIHRVRKGFYNVTLGAIAAYGGHAQVTAYGGNAHCQAASWRRGIVNIACYGPDGTPIDTRYSLLFHNGSGQDYLLADNPTSSNYEPAVIFANRGRTAAHPHIARTGPGAYRVNLDGAANRGGNIQITAYGDEAVYCNVRRWRDRDVEVRCFAIASRKPTDARFTLLFTRDTTDATYVWADKPDLSRYRADTRFTNSKRDIVITRKSTGLYAIRLGEPVRRGGGNAQVTAYGSDAHCTLPSWSRDSVLVACFRGNEPQDTRFSLLFTHAPLDAARGSHQRQPEATPACAGLTKVIEYQRVGGIAGFSTRLEVFDEGCDALGERIEHRVGRLSGVQLENVNAWRKRWRSFAWQQRSPAGIADGMFVRLSFTGSGDEPANPEAQRAIQEWIQQLIGRRPPR